MLKFNIDTKNNIMDKTISSNIHNLIKQYKELNVNEENFNYESFQELGKKFAKEIFRLPINQQGLAWNIVADSFCSHYKDPQLNTEALISIGHGALNKLIDDKQRFLVSQGLTHGDISDEAYQKDLNQRESSFQEFMKDKENPITQAVTTVKKMFQRKR